MSETARCVRYLWRRVWPCSSCTARQAQVTVHSNLPTVSDDGTAQEALDSEQNVQGTHRTAIQCFSMPECLLRDSTHRSEAAVYERQAVRHPLCYSCSYDSSICMRCRQLW